MHPPETDKQSYVTFADMLRVLTRCIGVAGHAPAAFGCDNNTEFDMPSITLPILAAATLLGFAGAAWAQQQQSGQQAQGMDMNQFMARCAQIRQQPSTSQTPQGRQMLDRCDQMDRSMGMTPPPRR